MHIEIMKIKKFNEEIGNPSYPNPHRPMKQFVLTTTSESSDHSPSLMLEPYLFY